MLNLSLLLRLVSIGVVVSESSGSSRSDDIVVPPMRETRKVREARPQPLEILNQHQGGESSLVVARVDSQPERLWV